MRVKFAALLLTVFFFQLGGVGAVLAAPTEDDIAGSATIYATGSQGSGFFISDTELITAAHVVGDATSVRVSKGDGLTRFKGQVSAIDFKCDVALIKIDSGEKNFFAVQEEPVSVGASVYAIGSPIGRPVISVGKVEKAGTNWLRTSVPVDFGSSGGPLLNENSEVIGVVLMKSTLGNAIALPMAKANKCLSGATESVRPSVVIASQSVEVILIASLALIFSVAALLISVIALARMREKRRPIIITLPPEEEKER